MNYFFEMYRSEIIAAIISIIVAILTTLVTHSLSNLQIRYTEKMKIVSDLSKLKYEGIKKIRNEIIVLRQYEDLGLTENPDSLIPENRGRFIQTPSCCYNYDSLFDMSRKMNDLHKEYGHCLSHRAVLFLVFIKKFIYEYAMKCYRAGLSDEELRWASVPLYGGLCEWHRSFERELIKSMNNPSLKYYSHTGLHYKLLYKRYEKYFIRSEPFLYLNDSNSMLNQTIKSINRQQ